MKGKEKQMWKQLSLHLWSFSCRQILLYIVF